jgi:hypothetical protein
MTALRGSPELVFKSPDLQAKLRPFCQEVLTHFGPLPPLRLLCYFDDENPEWLQREFGEFAASHVPVIGGGVWPGYVESLLIDSSGELAFDNLIYVPASRFSQEKVSFVLMFAHELQHFVRWGNSRKVSQANTLLHQHLRSFDPATQIKPWSLPLNRDAMIVAKRVAVAVCGAEPVAQFITAQINEGRASNNLSKTQMWEWAQSISPSSRDFDLNIETDRLVQKYKDKLAELNSEIDFSVQGWWHFHTNDIFIHRTEGWYGIVEKHRGDSDEDEFYTVQTLERRKFVGPHDMIAVDREDVPFEFRDLRVTGRSVEKAESPLNKLFDLATKAALELDKVAPSIKKKELSELIFRVRAIISDLRTR